MKAATERETEPFSHFFELFVYIYAMICPKQKNIMRRNVNFAKKNVDRQMKISLVNFVTQAEFIRKTVLPLVCTN
jgi:hypothetical protein